MAQIEMEEGVWFGHPRCSGCGERFTAFVPALLHPTARGPAFSEDYRRLGSKGAEIAAWAARHAACPDPRWEVTTSGVAIVDRRQR